MKGRAISKPSVVCGRLWSRDLWWEITSDRVQILGDSLSDLFLMSSCILDGVLFTLCLLLMTHFALLFANQGRDFSPLCYTPWTFQLLLALCILKSPKSLFVVISLGWIQKILAQGEQAYSPRVGKGGGTLKKESCCNLRKTKVVNKKERKENESERKKERKNERVSAMTVSCPLSLCTLTVISACQEMSPSTWNLSSLLIYPSPFTKTVSHHLSLRRRVGVPALPWQRRRVTLKRSQGTSWGWGGAMGTSLWTGQKFEVLFCVLQGQEADREAVFLFVIVGATEQHT